MRRGNTLSCLLLLSVICSCQTKKPLILPYNPNEVRKDEIERMDPLPPPEVSEDAVLFDPVVVLPGDCEGHPEVQGLLLDEGKVSRCKWHKTEHDRLGVENETLWQLVGFYRDETDSLILYIENDLVPTCERSWFEEHAFVLGLATGTLTVAVLGGIIGGIVISASD